MLSAVALVVIVAAWLGGKRTAADATAPDPSMPLASSRPPGEPPHDPFFTKHPRSQAAETAAHAASAPVAAAVPNLVTNWEDKLDKILTSESEDPDKARQMLEMFPRLPEDAQVEVAQHLSNLTPDQDYASMAKLLANASLPEAVLDVLLADALNRPNSLKLPALLEVARDPQNPKAAEAKDLLQLFLDEDYGSDWNTWQSKMEAWLKDNPD